MQPMKIHSLLFYILMTGMLLLLGCSGGNQEDNPPVPGGGGEIEIDPVYSDSVTVRWQAASDENTPSNFLDYLVVYSTTNNIGDLASAEKNGKKAPLYSEEADSDESEAIYWNKNITSLKIKDLDDGIQYYFNVIVRDRAWRRSVYRMKDEKTTDVTAPKPGNGGLVTTTNETVHIDNTVSLTLTWTKASDNNSSGPSVLEYRVVQSLYPDISTITGIENKDSQTPDLEPVWTKDINSFEIKGLPIDTLHYFNVMVRDEAKNTAIYTMTSQAPTAGDAGVLAISAEVANGLTLNWTKATDGGNDQSQIQYRVIRSTSNNINRIETAEDNDQTPALEQKWYNNIASLTIVGLIPETEYYFNVIAKDVAGFKVLYEQISNAPTPKGSLSITNVQPTTLTLVWTKAIDSGSESETLSYSVYRSTSNNLDSLENTLTNGTVIQSWTNNITFLDVTGLQRDTDYYFNVVVRDATGHKKAYESVASPAETRLPKDTSTLERSSSELIGGQSTVGQALLSRAIAGSSEKVAADTAETATPLSIDKDKGHLVIWLDATLPATGSVDPFPIAIWKDKSREKNHALQPIETFRPFIELSTTGDTHPRICFDASRNQHLFAPLGADIQLQKESSACSIYMVAGDLQNESGHPVAFLLDSADEAGNRNGLYYYQTSRGETALGLRTDRAYPLLTDIPETIWIMTAVFGKDETGKPFGSVSVNGQTCPLPVSASIPPTVTRLLLGAGWSTPDLATAADFMTGGINELIIYDRKLTAEEHQTILAYLRNKWGR
ncbi:MAG: fibronectin type III domain-containing protein [Thermodesulfobacteriota bacterium]